MSDRRTFCLVWATMRGLMELLASFEASYMLYEQMTTGRFRTKALTDTQGMIQGGFPSLILTGIVILTQTAGTIAICSHSKYPPHFVKILGYQSLALGLLFLLFLNNSLLPASYYIYAAFTIVCGIITLAETYHYKAPNWNMDSLVYGVVTKPTAEDKEDSQKKSKPRVLAPGIKIAMFVAGVVGMLLCYVPEQINGIFNVGYRHFDLEIMKSASHCVTLLACVNMAQGIAVLLAAYWQDFDFLWANSQAALMGAIVATVTCAFSNGGFLPLSLGVKYTTLYVWYWAQMYVMWPNKYEKEEESIYYGYDEDLGY